MGAVGVKADEGLEVRSKLPKIAQGKHDCFG